MKETQKIQWKRVWVEAAAIVASILLAFAIDASWEQRQQRDEAKDQLVAILADMQTAEEYVQWYRKVSLARQESVERLMVAASSASDRPADESLDEMLSHFNWPTETNIMAEGSIEALILSGNLRLIESEVLRRKLSGWSSFLSYLREMIRQDYQFNSDVWMPYLQKNGESMQIESANKGEPGHEGEEWGGELPETTYEPFDHSIFLDDREFRNILVQLWVIQDSLQQAFKELETEVSQTISLIRDEIERQ